MKYFNKLSFTVVFFVLVWCGVAHPNEVKANGESAPAIRDIFLNDSPISSSIIKKRDYQLVNATFFKSLGAEVNWHDSTRTVEINYLGTILHYPIGENYVLIKNDNNQDWQQEIIPSIAPFIVEGRSYIPLAFTVKLFGKDIYYDSKNKVTHINSSQDSSELYWLYRITEAEAGGESYDGKVAVAATVLNRVEHKDWPNSVEETIFQVVEINGVSYYQFEPVVNNYIYEVKPSADTMRAVNAAVAGEDPTNGGVVFYNPEKTTNKWVKSRPISIVIGSHTFAY